MMKKHLLFIAILFIYSKSFAQNITDIPPPPPPPSDTADRVFSKVEFEAEFPGGLDAWKQYLQKNLRGNVPVKKKAPTGTYTIVVKFIVSKDGSISSIAPETNFGYGMEDEVVRVIRKGPDWIPAVQNGKKVNAYRRQPITFVISDR